MFKFISILFNLFCLYQLNKIDMDLNKIPVLKNEHHQINTQKCA